MVIFQRVDLEFELIFDFRSNKMLAISRKNEDSELEIQIPTWILLFSWKSEETFYTVAATKNKHCGYWLTVVCRGTIDSDNDDFNLVILL